MKAWRDLRYLPRDLWLLCGATLINRLGTMALPFLVLYLTRTFEWSVARAGSVLTLYAVGALCVAPIAGRISDRWGASASPPRRDVARVSPRHGLSRLMHAFPRDPALRPFVLGFLPVGMVFWQDISTLPLVMVRVLHLSPAAYGTLFTINTLLIVAIEIPLNSATAHWRHGRTLALGAFLFAVGYGSMAFARTHAAVIATTIIWTFGEMSVFPSAAAYVSEIAPPHRLRDTSAPARGRGDHLSLDASATQP